MVVEGAVAQLDGAGFVLAGIGSLQDARLRLAAAVDDTLLPGPSELLTLAGSLSADGAHLHATLALADGRVVGGHLPYGNTVRTTAELLLAPLPGWRPQGVRQWIATVVLGLVAASLLGQLTRWTCRRSCSTACWSGSW